LRSGEPHSQTADVVRHELAAVEAEQPHAAGMDEQEQADRVAEERRRLALGRFRREAEIAERPPQLAEHSPGLCRALADADIVLDERHADPAHGVPAAATLDAIRLAARLEGMLTDLVYEGKSMQGMIDMVRSGRFPAGAKLLYVHLGGVPTLSAYSNPLREG